MLPEACVEVVFRPTRDLSAKATADEFSGGVGLGEADTVTSRRLLSGLVFISNIGDVYNVFVMKEKDRAMTESFCDTFHFLDE